MKQEATNHPTKPAAHNAAHLQEGVLSGAVMGTLRQLTAHGEFDAILEEARGCAFTRVERRAFRAMES